MFKKIFFSLCGNLLAYVDEKPKEDELIDEAKKWDKYLPKKLKVQDAPRLFKIAVLHGCK